MGIVEKFYRDRQEAGQTLAGELEGYRELDPVVLGLPRGGVIPAAVVAEALGLVLDVFSVAKLRAPENPEFAIGAVSESGEVYLERGSFPSALITEAWIEAEKARALNMMRARLQKYRAVREKVPVKGRAVIIVDDGLATGATMTGAAYAARAEGATVIIAAAAVGAREAIKRVGALKEVFAVVCPLAPQVFFSVSQFYLDFHEVSVAEVCGALKRQTST